MAEGRGVLTSMFSKRGGAARICEQADRARDGGDWATAKDLYKQFLEIEPTQSDIWVQYGHGLKECGDLDGAVTAYKRAIEVRSDVADYHLQLGHALKLQDDLAGAELAYRRAHELDNRSPAIIRELAAFDKALVVRAKTSDNMNVHAVDLSDVFFYLRHHPTLSGIQRVQLGIADAIVELGKSPIRFVFVVNDPALGEFISIQQADIVRLIAELNKPVVSHTSLKSLMAEAEANGTIISLGRGDALLVFGAFWVIENAVERFTHLKRNGVALIILIHDIIPIINPEYCEASLTDTFKVFCVHILQIADLILTVSDHSGRTVEQYAKSRNISTPPIRTLRSAHVTWQPKGEKPVVTKSRSKISGPYVLYVSTIEIRKNHTLLFRVWKELLLRHGPRAVPKLVFVGRPGWRVRDLMDQLKSTSNLDGHIVILHGLSDNELAALYEGAMFSSFPSFEEGWGLPVGESLVHGTPVVASNTSSIPEVAGDFVVYADPNNLKESIDVYERMIFNEREREALRQRIRDTFRPRTWKDVTKDLLDALQNMPASDSSGSAVPVPYLQPGKLYHVGHGDNANAYVRHGIGEYVSFLFDESWGAIENFGRWLLKREGHLRFKIRRYGVESIVIVLGIDSVPWNIGPALTLTVNGQLYHDVHLIPGRRSYVRFTAEVLDDEVDVALAVTGDIPKGDDPRPLTFGLHAFAFSTATDIVSRLNMFEEIACATGALVGAHALPRD